MTAIARTALASGLAWTLWAQRVKKPLSASAKGVAEAVTAAGAADPERERQRERIGAASWLPTSS
jgi:hypothetical protein